MTLIFLSKPKKSPFSKPNTTFCNKFNQDSNNHDIVKIGLTISFFTDLSNRRTI